ncbi:polyprenyl diphosphate synthase [Buchnera aphidicola]|uniref:polyprenyl diphosphate synthase n=1 Tax=Buchnera aphidicola TaxID=9 RepID=UPI003463851C
MQSIIKKNLLRHVAIIMDGNRRWAKNKGKFLTLGYKAGIKAIHRTINFAILNKIEMLTLYAFSRENWYRPISEIKLLMKFFLKILDNDINNFNKNNIRLKFIGDTTSFNSILQKKIKLAEKSTMYNDGLILNIAANYGGRWDIIEGIKKIIKKVELKFLHIDEIQESTLENLLNTKDLIPVDLVIRTGGEYRISNFLIWQIAYSELYFTDVLWPDFNDFTFKSAIESFAKRKRRFGS